MVRALVLEEGMQFGDLKLTERLGRDQWHCRCSCGEQRICQRQYLLGVKRPSCRACCLARQRDRGNYPGRQPLCGRCGRLKHRVRDYPACSACGLEYEPLPPLRFEGELIGSTAALWADKRIL